MKEEALYLTLFTPPRGAKNKLGVDIVRAENLHMVKTGFEEVERIRSSRITRIANLTQLDDVAYGREKRFIDSLIHIGKSNFVFFDSLYDRWKKKIESEQTIFNHTKITKDRKILFVGVELTDSTAYINLLVDVVASHYGYPSKNINIINAHIYNRVDGSLMLNLIDHRVLASDEVVFLYANKTPSKRDARTILKKYPTCKLLYTVKDRVIKIDNQLKPWVII